MGLENASLKNYLLTTSEIVIILHIFSNIMKNMFLNEKFRNKSSRILNFSSNEIKMIVVLSTDFEITSFKRTKK